MYLTQNLVLKPRSNITNLPGSTLAHLQSIFPSAHRMLFLKCTSKFGNLGRFYEGNASDET